jgi:hypothetical protein
LRLSTLSILLAWLVTSAAAADAPAPDVESVMSAQDFAAAGLNKLTDAERKHLSEWLERYREGAVIGPPPAPRRLSEMDEKELVVAKEQREQERDTRIVAKVLPTFRGWSGSTVFHLDNGQTWQQRQAGRMRYSGSESTVVISQNIMGRYVLTHPDSGRAVGVKRLR